LPRPLPSLFLCPMKGGGCSSTVEAFTYCLQCFVSCGTVVRKGTITDVLVCTKAVPCVSLLLVFGLDVSLRKWCLIVPNTQIFLSVSGSPWGLRWTSSTDAVAVDRGKFSFHDLHLTKVRYRTGRVGKRLIVRAVYIRGLYQHE
jgi:hypothetical protein